MEAFLLPPRAVRITHKLSPECPDLESSQQIARLVQRWILASKRPPNLPFGCRPLVSHSTHEQINTFPGRHLAEVELDREDDPGATVHAPEEHTDAVLCFVRRPFLANLCGKTTIPQQQFPVHGPAFDPERRLEELAVRVIAVHVVELKMMAGYELMEHGGSGECRAVAAHAHQFVFVRHAARWVGDDNSLAAEEERVDFLACWCHHGRFPEIFRGCRHGDEVVFLHV